ncbi:hypothetical protein SAMN04487851_105177 [Prevotella sp. tc2-28]|nr:hypothetical protein SAMN04487851_105177 [Prevotella sp. tc2-28]
MRIFPKKQKGNPYFENKRNGALLETTPHLIQISIEILLCLCFLCGGSLSFRSLLNRSLGNRCFSLWSGLT